MLELTEYGSNFLCLVAWAIYIYIYSWKLGWSRSRYMGWSRTRTGHASIRAWSFNSWLTSQFFVLLMLLMLLFFHRWLNKYTIHWQFMKFEILWFLWTSTIVSFLIEMLNLPPFHSQTPTSEHQYDSLCTKINSSFV